MAPAAIWTLGLTKHFGRVIALDALDLDVSAAEIFGFPGPNGARKSTTIRLLPGLIRPPAAATSSSVTFADVQARAS
jgi:ABC-2 type transport system ATP-binding protein